MTEKFQSIWPFYTKIQISEYHHSEF